MKIYTIGYGSYEDSGSIQIIHEKEFPREVWDGMVFRASVEAAKRKLIEDRAHYEDRYGLAYREMADRCEAKGNLEKAILWRKKADSMSEYGSDGPHISYDQLYEPTAKIMVEWYGFEIFQRDHGVCHASHFMGWDNLAASRGFNDSREDPFLESLSQAIRRDVTCALTEEEIEELQVLHDEARVLWYESHDRAMAEINKMSYEDYMIQKANQSDEDYDAVPLDADLLRAFGADEDEISEITSKTSEEKD